MVCMISVSINTSCFFFSHTYLFIDALHQIIPNVLSIPLLITGIIFVFIPGNDVGIINGLVTGAVVFCLLLFFSLGLSKNTRNRRIGWGRYLAVVYSSGNLFWFNRHTLHLFAFCLDGDNLFPYFYQG